jgi:hypothetical protein
VLGELHDTAEDQAARCSAREWTLACSGGASGQSGALADDWRITGIVRRSLLILKSLSVGTWCRF